MQAQRALGRRRASVDDLLSRSYVQVSREAAAHVSQEAAAADAAAAEGVAPSATNNAQLHAAQQLYASMHRMEVRGPSEGGGAGAGLRRGFCPAACAYTNMAISAHAGP